MRRIHDRVAGLDVHKNSVVASSEWLEERKVMRERCEFATTARGVRDLAEWLRARGVDHVVMESTGVYWKPVYYGLEDHVEDLLLANARHVKNVPGRKTDMSDADWLADLAAHGMLRGSFVPPPAVREFRELTRRRKALTKMRTQEIQRLEKLFQDAGIKFTSVASGVWLKSSEAMVEALIAGERDPLILAGLAKGKLSAKTDALAEAMENRWTQTHSEIAQTHLALIRRFDSQMAELGAQIKIQRSRWQRQFELLVTVPGIADRVAEAVIAETGADMSVFPTADHLASWAGLSPGNDQSAGNRRNAPTLKGNPTIKTVMVEAAKAAVRTDGFLKARYQRIRRRRGPNKATIAVARSMMIGIWHMLTNDVEWEDLGADYYDKRRDPDKEAQRKVKELEALGFTVTLNRPAA